MLTMVLLKEEFATKLVFLCGLKPWVQKIIFQKMEISITCSGLMKMVGCMEDKGPSCLKVKPKAKSPKSTMLAQAMGAKVATNTTKAKASRGFTMTRKSCKARSCWQKR